MLELKSHHLIPKPEPTTWRTITDLPAELHDYIVRQLYYDGRSQVDAILPLSKVCRPLRNSALPMLFEVVTCVARASVTEIPHPFFAQFVSQTHLLLNVRELRVRPGLRSPSSSAELGEASFGHEPEQSPWEDDLALIEAALKGMPNLNVIRFRGRASALLSLLQSLEPYRNVSVATDYVFFGSGFSDRLPKLCSLLRERTVALGFLRSFGPPPFFSEFKGWSLPHVKNVTSWTLTAAVPGAEKETVSPIQACDGGPPALQDLRIFHWEARHANQHLREQLRLVPWSCLRRLAINNISNPFPALDDNAESGLPNLCSLSLNFNYQYSDFGTCRDVEHATPWYSISPSLLHKLHHLQIRGVCNHAPIQNLAGQNLRSLALTRPSLEASVRPSFSERSPADLIALSNLSPLLNKLELDTGPLENLWHPSAVPGVDVNPETYQFLHALSNFTRLEYLTLRPPYAREASDLPSQVDRSARYYQPISDHQAVRLFHHLRAENPQLQRLRVTTSHDFPPPRATHFWPMSWHVRKRERDKTTLVTRQRGSDYEQRQTWVGERRLMMRVRKDAYARDLGHDASDPDMCVSASTVASDWIEDDD